MSARNPFIWLARLLLALQLLWVPQAVMAAAYATGGSGKYKNEILWLTWGGGVNGTAGRSISNGQTTDARIQVTADTELQVSCQISGIQSSKGLKSYRPGDWRGDTLDESYFIGGSSTGNQLISGIVASGGPDNFKVTCNSNLARNGVSRAVNLRGFVIADAESMAPGEYILGASRGKWSIIEHLGTNKTAYYVDKRTPTAGAQIIGNSGDSYIKLFSKDLDGERGVVTFLQFDQQSPTQSMAFQIKGNGNTAISIGLLVPFADFGDAPKSYDAAMHLIADINFSDDGIGAAGETNALSTSLSPSKLNPPRTIYLGSTGPDSEPSTPFSSDAKGDDNGGQSALPGSAFYGREEDAWPTAQRISVLDAGSTLNVTLNCSSGTTAPVAGWIDFDQNGVFDGGAEHAAGVCSGGRATLTWAVPPGLKVGKTFARLRIASDAAQIAAPFGVADDGEAEDHQIEILGPKLSVKKTASPANTPWSAYSSVPYTYSLAVANIGAVETWTKAQADAVNSTVWKPVTVVDELPLGVEYLSSSGSDWTCTATTPYSPTTKTQVTCTYNVAKSIQSGQSGSALTLSVKLHPEIHQSSSLINTAKVFGSLDPFLENDPCDSVHCSNARVVVEQPNITVQKSANPTAPTSVTVGGEIEYTLKVTVTGPLTWSGLALNDFLGEGLEYLSVVSQTPAAPVWVDAPAPSNQSLQPHVFTLPPEVGVVPELAAGSTRTYSLTYKAKVLESAGTAVVNQVRATAPPLQRGLLSRPLTARIAPHHTQ